MNCCRESKTASATPAVGMVGRFESAGTAYQDASLKRQNRIVVIFT
jgi:hypothetical protein